MVAGKGSAAGDGGGGTAANRNRAAQVEHLITSGRATGAGEGAAVECYRAKGVKASRHIVRRAAARDDQRGNNDGISAAQRVAGGKRQSAAAVHVEIARRLRVAEGARRGIYKIVGPARG